MTETEGKVKVSLRALEARCKRYAETHDGDTLKRCRQGTSAHAELGDYYFVDVRGNYVTASGWSEETLIEWAREKGILKPYEEVAA
ncbi:hypothetical protein [Extensimonas vulgaris]|uniref:Uncharacterized protein n=1 Tax=Extensimonas vulgaris TaxID=1031594 RepID=A0A369AK65_9BURK|nr:hypothetical protein [Extensimonas vulgaris]RCX09799.1 hypothetical protein DFR45_104167 [Extensimonas vulgaris]TWI39429.1 hypothetical protein IP95_01334 [Extensimonas vulgaris]TXD15671.1 hypothetical protein FUT63_07065 [Extensimonas vulgaris]